MFDLNIIYLFIQGNLVPVYNDICPFKLSMDEFRDDIYFLKYN